MLKPKIQNKTIIPKPIIINHLVHYQGKDEEVKIGFNQTNISFEMENTMML
jgi:hypothetical protein